MSAINHTVTKEEEAKFSQEVYHDFGLGQAHIDVHTQRRNSAPSVMEPGPSHRPHRPYIEIPHPHTQTPRVLSPLSQMRRHRRQTMLVVGLATEKTMFEHAGQHSHRQMKRLPTLRSKKTSIDMLAFGPCDTIFEACEKGRLDELKRLLTSPDHHRIGQLATHVDIDDKDRDPSSKTYGQTALMIAVNHGDEKVVKEILKWHADLSVTDDLSQRTAVHMASHLGHTHILSLLLEHVTPSTAAKEVKRLDGMGYCALFLSKLGRKSSAGAKVADYVKIEEMLQDAGASLNEDGAVQRQLASGLLVAVWGHKLVTRARGAIASRDGVVSPSKLRSELLKSVERGNRIGKGTQIRESMQASGEWSKLLDAGVKSPVKESPAPVVTAAASEQGLRPQKPNSRLQKLGSGFRTKSRGRHLRIHDHIATVNATLSKVF